MEEERKELSFYTRKSYSTNLRKINEDNLRFPKANLSGKVIEESFHVIESCCARR